MYCGSQFRAAQHTSPQRRRFSLFHSKERQNNVGKIIVSLVVFSETPSHIPEFIFLTTILCEELEDVIPAVLGQLVPGASLPWQVPASGSSGQNRGSSRTVSENHQLKEDCTYLLQTPHSVTSSAQHLQKHRPTQCITHGINTLSLLPIILKLIFDIDTVINLFHH